MGSNYEQTAACSISSVPIQLDYFSSDDAYSPPPMKGLLAKGLEQQQRQHWQQQQQRENGAKPSSSHAQPITPQSPTSTHSASNLTPPPQSSQAPAIPSSPSAKNAPTQPAPSQGTTGGDPSRPTAASLPSPTRNDSAPTTPHGTSTATTAAAATAASPAAGNGSHAAGAVAIPSASPSNPRADAGTVMELDAEQARVVLQVRGPPQLQDINARLLNKLPPFYLSIANLILFVIYLTFTTQQKNLKLYFIASHEGCCCERLPAA